MNDTTVEYLKSQLAQALLLQRKAEEDGAELVMFYEAKVATLNAEIARLRQHEDNHEEALCRGCEIQSRMLGSIASIVIESIWLHFHPWNCSDGVDRLFGLYLSALPLGTVFFYWGLTRLDLKYHLVSLTDNDIYRAIQAWWSRIA